MKLKRQVNDRQISGGGGGKIAHKILQALWK